MNDNGRGQRMTLREEYCKQEQAWTQASEPVFRVWIDDSKDAPPGSSMACFGFPYFSLICACLLKDTATLSLQFPLGAVLITGPAVEKFFGEFCANKATCLKSDGKDILSITFVKQGMEPSEEAPAESGPQQAAD